jgi:hypothetical protein
MLSGDDVFSDEIYTAITGGSIFNKVADKISGNNAERGSKKPLGRPIAIDDGRLLNARDHLVFLFENSWADVGGRLRWIKKPADLLETLQVWEKDNRHNLHYLPQTLLRTSSTPATPRWLTVTRGQLRELNQAVRSADDAREKCRQSLETAQRALSAQLSEGERAVVEDQISRRSQRLAEAEVERVALSNRQQEVQELLLDGEACFARTEFVRFCKSNRYRLTPLNIANALAGLPYIGWRQSAKRCKKHAAPGVDGRSMQVFKTIQRILRSCTRRSDLVGQAERWLRAQKGTKSLGVSDLREKWYYLRWSIKTVLEASPRVPTRELPFAIAREYGRRIGRPSNVDLLFEEEERIVN